MGAYPPGYGAPGTDHTKDMYGGGPYGGDSNEPKEKKEKKKEKKSEKSGHGKLLAAGALGAVGGAIIAHEMSKSPDTGTRTQR
jgi:hypothetical protein